MSEHEIRESLLDQSSVGYELTQVLYGKREPRVKYAKNKKVSVNLRLRVSDLALLDAIAEKYGRTRAWIITYLLETDIERMFDAITPFEDSPQAQLAVLVDEQISESGLEHDRKGKTWVLDADHALLLNLGNPGYPTIYDKQQTQGND